MPENDYTGSPIEVDGQLALLEGLDYHEFDVDGDDDVLYAEDENETLIHVGGAANGAKSLQEAAERLYDFADELLTLSNEGWEIVDDISNGHGTAVRFDVDEDEDLDDG